MSGLRKFGTIYKFSVVLHMSAFSMRLRELRAVKKVTQKHVAESIGISVRAYQHYELDEKEPTLGNINKLADFFEVTTDYLLGRSDNPQ